MTKKKKPKYEPKAKAKDTIHPVQWLSAVIVIIYLFGTLIPVHFTWGFNIWSVFPAPFSFAVLILAGLLIVAPVSSRFHSKFESLKQAAYDYFQHNNRYFNFVLLSVFLFLLFYFFRSRAFVYGDGYLTLSGLTSPEFSFDFSIYFMKPLAVLFHRGIYILLSGFIAASPANILAATNAVGGVLGFWALNRIARNIAGRNNNHWVILTGTLCTASVVLFFGYMENYTWVTALSLWSLAFSLGYLKGHNGPLPGIVLGVIAAGFHVLAVTFLIISILAIFIRNKSIFTTIGKSPAKIYVSVTALSFLAALVFQTINFPDYIVKIWPVEKNPYWFLSPAHLIDIFNLLLLVAPLGLAVFLFSISRKSDRYEQEPAEYLLALTALLSFLISFWVNPELGAPRDWDLLSLCGFPITVWGVYTLNRKYPNTLLRMRFLLPLGLLALVLLAPNLYEKNSLSTAAVRLDRMLWEDAHYQKSYKSADRCVYWSYILERQVGDYNRASRYYERYIATEAGGFDARLDWGKRYLDKGMTDSASFWLNSASEIDPDNAELLYYFSILEQSRGNIPKALSYIEQAVQKNTANGEYHTQLAILYQNSSKPQKALQHFQKAYQLEPASYLSALNLGKEFQKLKIYDSAVFYMNESLALSECALDKDDQFLIRLGYLELGLKRYDSALAHTRMALNISNQDITIHRQLGIILADMNKNKAALEHFREAWRLSPGSIQEIINLGLSFEKSDNYDSAYYYLSRGIDRGGDAVKNPVIYRSLFNSCLSLGKTAKAQQVLTELESFAPNYPDLEAMRLRLQ